MEHPDLLKNVFMMYLINMEYMYAKGVD